jgi:hypothetical protein
MEYKDQDSINLSSYNIFDVIINIDNKLNQHSS